ncbi:MAG: 5'-methylthioadenosine/adenosylhomocysteine nucleosidase, partial [Bacilli bacterium]|nr:5'-methylthioadenosine/adenosylhomocysteine nucleosidase [Bacilli bacterium]
MIGIIGALDAEIELLLAHSEVIEVTNHAGKRFVSARFANMPIVIAKSGIGKVNAT